MHDETSERSTGRGRGGATAVCTGGGAAGLARTAGAGMVLSASMIGGSVPGVNESGTSLGGAGERTFEDGEANGGAGGSSFSAIVGSGAEVTTPGVVGWTATAAARASRGRRGIPELPQSTCHSRYARSEAAMLASSSRGSRIDIHFHIARTIHRRNARGGERDGSIRTGRARKGLASPSKPLVVSVRI